MKGLRVSMQALTSLVVCFSLMACMGSSSSYVPQESPSDNQIPAVEKDESPAALQSSISEENVVDGFDGQKATTAKVFQKSSDVVTKQTNDDYWENRRASYEADRVEKICGTLYVYDPDDTSVNLRARPDGNVITQVANLSVVYRADDPYVWIEPDTWNSIRLTDGTRGYLWGDLLRHTAYRIYDPTDTSANLRNGPDGDVITTLPNDTEVEFLGESGSWTHVLTGRGTDGYVATSLLATPNCF